MRFSLPITLALVSVAAAGRVTAQAASHAFLEIDHQTGNERLIVVKGDRADTTALGKARVVRVDARTPVTVRVVNTNTAFYEFDAKSAAAQLPERATVQQFVGWARPYLPELRAALTRAVRGGHGQSSFNEGPRQDREVAAGAAVSAMRVAELRVSRALRDVDDAVNGRNGIREVTTTTLLALEEMRFGVPPESAGASIRALAGVPGPCGTPAAVALPSVKRLLASLGDVVEGEGELRAAAGAGDFVDVPAWRAARDTADTLGAATHALLTDFDSLLDSAYRLEQLAGLAAHACSRTDVATVPTSRTAGTTVTVEVTPRAEPEVARMAGRAPVKYEIGLQPRMPVRPLVAAGVLAMPDARFPKYGTRDVAGGSEVYETGRSDARFALAASLGLAWGGAARNDAGRVALWVPELVVATGGGAHGFGAGAAVSWHFVKVGAGAMWAKHGVLTNARVGDVLAAGSSAPVSDSYRDPRLYLSVTVLDWGRAIGGLR